MFIFETIDDSYQEVNVNFPYFMRLNKIDIAKEFPKCQLEAFVTYKFPLNKVSKTIYKICK
jgi:protein-L-isoaspartate(D-aspartate) O-methyltransferase